MKNCNCDYARTKNISWFCHVHGDMEASPQSSNWMEEFDYRFGRFKGGRSYVRWDKEKDEPVVRPVFRSEDLKQFISHLLASEKSRLVEEIKEIGHQQENDEIWCNMDEVIKLISK